MDNTGIGLIAEYLMRHGAPAFPDPVRCDGMMAGRFYVTVIWGPFEATHIARSVEDVQRRRKHCLMDLVATVAEGKTAD